LDRIRQVWWQPWWSRKILRSIFKWDIKRDCIRRPYTQNYPNSMFWAINFCIEVSRTKTTNTTWRLLAAHVPLLLCIKAKLLAEGYKWWVVSDRCWTSDFQKSVTLTTTPCHPLFTQQILAQTQLLGIQIRPPENLFKYTKEQEMTSNKRITVFLNSPLSC
jgi:hypothetical protein